MMLMMISARMFLHYCAAQALTRKGESTMEPQEDEMPFSGAMGRLSASTAEGNRVGAGSLPAGVPRERAGAGMTNENAHAKVRRGLAIDPAGIEWIEAEGGHSRIFTRNGSFRVRRNLQDLEKAWLANQIICISPVIMVNARRIRELRSCSRQRCEVVLESGRKYSCAFPFTLPLNQVLQGMHALGSDN